MNECLRMLYSLYFKGFGLKIESIKGNAYTIMVRAEDLPPVSPDGIIYSLHRELWTAYVLTPRKR